MTATEPLTKLSDHALLAELTRAVGARCQITARLVALVAEVEVRHLHLKAAYSSLYEYCLSYLHLSEGSANRLIAAARAARRYPEIIDMIAGGSLHLSGLQLLAPYLTPQNHAELLRESAHKTKAEITHIIRTHFPKPDVPSSTAPPPLQQLTPLSAHTFHVQFTATRELHDKLQRARDLMAQAPKFVCEPTRLARGDLAAVVERAVDLLIAQLEKRKFARTDKPRASRGRRPGDVSNQTRREVASRDDYQCAFIADDGRRCSARAGLEYDHIDAKARGGGEQPTNLRLYCRAHNQLHAIETYGEDFIRAKIHLRQRRSTPMATPSPAPPPSAVALRTKLIHALTHQGFPKTQAQRAVEQLNIAANASIPTLLRQAFALLVP